MTVATWPHHFHDFTWLLNLYLAKLIWHKIQFNMKLTLNQHWQPVVNVASMFCPHWDPPSSNGHKTVTTGWCIRLQGKSTCCHHWQNWMMQWFQWFQCWIVLEMAFNLAELGVRWCNENVYIARKISKNNGAFSLQHYILKLKLCLNGYCMVSIISM